jgi:hypothetical protein
MKVLMLRDYIARELNAILEERSIDAVFHFVIHRFNDNKATHIAIIEVLSRTDKAYFLVNLYGEKNLLRQAYLKLETLTIPEYLL